MCTSARIDTKNEGTTWTPNLGIMQGDSTYAYVFWTGIDTTVRNSVFHNAEVWVRQINKATLALGTATRIDLNNVVGGEAAWDWDGVGVCRLDSGVMIAAYGTQGTAPSIHAKESAANDSTSWGSRATVDNSGANRCFGGIGTDGTNVWAISQDQNNAKVYLWKRTAANTWDAGRVIHNLSANFASSPFYDIAPSYRLSAMRCIAIKDANTGCVVLGYSSAAATQDQVHALWTTDGWTNVNTTVIKSYVGSANSIASGAMPKIIKGTDGRVRAFWIENNATYGFVPVLAYSDDYGQHWTIIGTPLVFTGKSWDNTYDGAFVLDSANKVYCSVFDSSDATNIKHRLYIGGDSLTGWTETVCQNLAQTFSSACGSDGFVTNGQFIRVYNAVTSAVTGVAHNTVDYLYDAVPEDSGGGTHLVVESPSGSDLSNVYLRFQNATQRGWSKHDLSVACWSPWGEGTYLSQRRDPVLLAGAGVIDPTIGDVSNLPAIWRIDDPDRYTKESFITDGTNIIPRGDPFLFEWKSRGVPINRGMGQAVLRGFMLRYRRISAPFTVVVLIDGETSYTQVLQPSGVSMDEVLETFVPAKTDDNVGTYAQLYIADETEYPLEIQGWLPMRIDKGVRG